MSLTPEQIELWRYLEGLAGGDSVLDFVTRVSPRFSRPYHLGPLADALARARHGPVKVCISVPPRHGKTETILHSIAWRLEMDNEPETEIAYVSYEGNFAADKSKRAQDFATRAGLELRSTAGREWFTNFGAAVRATGIGGPLTGKGARLLIIDDPLKNREEAESPVMREKLWDWFTSTAMTRVEPGGSVVVCHTRWHDDDLIGRLETGMAGDDWEFINLPAIHHEGTTAARPLWPERWPIHELLGKRRIVGEYDWASMFMGMPRPKGGRLFGDPAQYLETDTLDNSWHYVLGVDPAATEKTSSDYSVIVVLAFKGKPFSLDHQARVMDVWRGQVQIPELVRQISRVAADWGMPGTRGAPVAVEAVGGFRAVPQMLREQNPRLRIFETSPTTDKFVRSQTTAAAWNDKRISVPVRSKTEPAWLRPFLAEVQKFTGVKDKRDDQVDALVHAFNGSSLAHPGVRGVKVPGWREI